MHPKRAVARDLLALMHHLGRERFAVVGRDQGGYVASLLTSTPQHAMAHIAVLGRLPIAEALDRAHAGFAAACWHWFSFTQPYRPASPDAWYGGDPKHMGVEDHPDDQRALCVALTQSRMTVPPAAPPLAPRRLWSSRDDLDARLWLIESAVGNIKMAQSVAFARLLDPVEVYSALG